MIAKDRLISALRELCDEDFQRKAWLASSGPVVSSFSEQVSQTFDDTGISDALESGSCPAELTEEGFSALKNLSQAIRKVDQSLPASVLVQDMRMRDVRSLARQALNVIVD